MKDQCADFLTSETIVVHWYENNCMLFSLCLMYFTV